MVRKSKKDEAESYLLGDVQEPGVGLRRRLAWQQEPVQKKQSKLCCRSKKCCCTCICITFALLACVLVLAACTAFGGFTGLGAYILNQSFAFDRKSQANICSRLPQGISPSNFTQYASCEELRPNMDRYLPEYFVPQGRWRNVEFASRPDDNNASITIRALVLEQEGQELDYNPWVIVSHGYHCCKEFYASLLPAGMLFKNGFNVLAVDLRNHGASDSDPLKFITFGSQEHFDILGAVDYLKQTYPRLAKKDCVGCRNQIGLFGVSMGGSTVTTAFGQDRGDTLRAVFLDSPALDIVATLEHAVYTRTSNSTILSKLVTNVGKFAGVILRAVFPYGYPPFKYQPITSVTDTPDIVNQQRYVHIDATFGDMTVPQTVAADFAQQLNAKGGFNVTTYFVESGQRIVDKGCDDHVVLMVSDPHAYEGRLARFFRSTLHFFAPPPPPQ